MDEERIQRKLTAIFSADVVGYSRLMRDDEMATIRTLSEYRELMSGLILQHKGRVVDAPGDNILAEFSSIVDAVQSAVTAQRELKARNAGLPENRKMEFRIGINIGDVIQEGDRIYGDGVNIAARLESIADPRGICISRSAYDQIESKLPFGYTYLGEKVAKNIDKPLYAYRVILDPESETHNENIAVATGSESRRTHDKRATGNHKKHRRRRPDRKAGHRLDPAATGVASDPELRQAIEEIRNNVDRDAAGAVNRRPAKREKMIEPFMQNKHIRFALGFGFFIFAINAVTSFGQWWFQFPLLFVSLMAYLRWIKGSLLLSNKILAKREEIFNEEMAHLPTGSEATGKERARIDRRVRDITRFYRSAYTYLGVNLFLFLINLFTTPFNWWFKFPLIIWSFILFLHWMKVNERSPG
ncbi:MAG: adenylate/guanylate cyclase domain-containing protein [Desulfobacterales bacterium]